MHPDIAPALRDCIPTSESACGVKAPRSCAPRSLAAAPRRARAHAHARAHDRAPSPCRVTENALTGEHKFKCRITLSGNYEENLTMLGRNGRSEQVSRAFDIATTSRWRVEGKKGREGATLLGLSQIRAAAAAAPRR
eukprot:5539314-Pleurochrysis_carterae.AAC.1